MDMFRSMKRKLESKDKLKGEAGVKSKSKPSDGGGTAGATATTSDGIATSSTTEGSRSSSSAATSRAGGSGSSGGSSSSSSGGGSSSSSVSSSKRKSRVPKYGYIDLLQSRKSLKDVSDPDERNRLVIEKLQLCCVIFDFTQQDITVKHSADYHKARDVKRQILMELGDFVAHSKSWLVEDMMSDILQMLRSNLFRSLPPPIYEDFDPEEDDPNFDSAWPHLQFVYEFFHRFVMTADVKMIRRNVDKKFLLNVIELFNSEDPRERDYLKMILHRIYGRCMPFRAFIRKALNNVLYPIMYANARHNGVSEILEILGSIINGFAMPLKEEHVLFLKNVLIPLHKVPTLSQFHQQLAYCMTQFIQKDPTLASSAIGGLLKFWPATSCSKELLFINELEELLELTVSSQLETVIEPLFERIAKAICSRHFQVAERALFLWNNDIIATFTSEHRKVILPIIYPALQQNYEKHWNSTVSSLTLNIIRIFKEMDKKLFDSVNKKYLASKEEPESKRRKREERWTKLERTSGSASSSAAAL